MHTRLLMWCNCTHRWSRQLQRLPECSWKAASAEDKISLSCDNPALQWKSLNLIIWLFHSSYIYNLADLWGKGKDSQPITLEPFPKVKAREHSLLVIHKCYISEPWSLWQKIGRRTQVNVKYLSISRATVWTQSINLILASGFKATDWSALTRSEI